MKMLNLITINNTNTIGTRLDLDQVLCIVSTQPIKGSKFKEIMGYQSTTFVNIYICKHLQTIHQKYFKVSLKLYEEQTSTLCLKCSNIVVVQIFYASYFSAFSSAHNKYIDVREKKLIYTADLQEVKEKKESIYWYIGHFAAPVQSKMQN